MSMYYEIELSRDRTENGAQIWMVISPQFPEVTTFGKDKADACLNGRKAIEEAIAGRIADGDPVPLPVKRTGRKGAFVEVPALIYLKVALYAICRSQNVSRAELARRLRWHREQVDRLFRLDHKSQLDQIEAAMDALGVPLAFDIPFPDAA